MNLPSPWQQSLKTAANALERTPNAPDWLRLAVLDAIEVAPDLAAPTQPITSPPDFFYPH
ncbi:MAG: hypothetical protein ABSG96_20060 [Terracidiphilus sp.]|jgi:hypothetical protein